MKTARRRTVRRRNGRSRRSTLKGGSPQGLNLQGLLAKLKLNIAKMADILTNVLPRRNITIMKLELQKIILQKNQVFNCPFLFQMINTMYTFLLHLPIRSDPFPQGNQVQRIDEDLRYINARIVQMQLRVKAFLHENEIPFPHHVHNELYLAANKVARNASMEFIVKCDDDIVPVLKLAVAMSELILLLDDGNTPGSILKQCAAYDRTHRNQCPAPCTFKRKLFGHNECQEGDDWLDNSRSSSNAQFPAKLPSGSPSRRKLHELRLPTDARINSKRAQNVTDTAAHAAQRALLQQLQMETQPRRMPAPRTMYLPPAEAQTPRPNLASSPAARREQFSPNRPLLTRLKGLFRRRNRADVSNTSRRSPSEGGQLQRRRRRRTVRKS